MRRGQGSAQTKMVAALASGVLDNPVARGQENMPLRHAATCAPRHSNTAREVELNAGQIHSRACHDQQWVDVRARARRRLAVQVSRPGPYQPATPLPLATTRLSQTLLKTKAISNTWFSGAHLSW